MLIYSEYLCCVSKSFLFHNFCWDVTFLFGFQQKLQLRKKRRKEREALGDKVSLLYFPVQFKSSHHLSRHSFVIWFININHIHFNVLMFIVGSTKGSAQDYRKPEGVWRDNSEPRGWRGMELVQIIAAYSFEFATFCVPYRWHLTRQLMNFLPTLTGLRILKCSSQRQTDPEG